MANLALVIILAIIAMISTSDDGGSLTDITAIILMHWRTHNMADLVCYLRPSILFGFSGQSFPCGNVGLSYIILALCGKSVVVELVAELVD